MSPAADLDTLCFRVSLTAQALQGLADLTHVSTLERQPGFEGNRETLGSLFEVLGTYLQETQECLEAAIGELRRAPRPGADRHRPPDPADLRRQRIVELFRQARPEHMEPQP